MDQEELEMLIVFLVCVFCAFFVYQNALYFEAW
jgi:hypothetical protein